jgi:hypothetical protein
VLLVPSRLSEWTKPILSANAYLGAGGIVAALRAKADIVVCGRVADASLIVGAAAWWHDWSQDDFDPLAQALLAGHAIECGGYVTGGNCGAFKDEFAKGNFCNFSPPIAEIGSRGEVVITKVQGSNNGFVNEHTVKHQLLYEIQGNIYLNSDVQADITNLTVTQVGKDRVQVSGVKGYAPPETTKVAICGLGGYEATVFIGATGPDITEKKMTIINTLKRTFPDLDKRFTTFVVEQYGVPMDNVSVFRE